MDEDFKSGSIENSTLPERVGKDSKRPMIGESRIESQVRPGVLVMGATGTGKSTFIAKVTGARVQIGNDLRPCTVECSRWDYTDDNRNVVTLIDTPGFNDLERVDMEILDTIVKLLQSDPRLRVVAVIYLHRITDNRITRPSRMNLRMLEAMCGEHFYQNVVLATTMWENTPENLLGKMKQREDELNHSRAFWADMIQKGSTYKRHLGTVETGKEIMGLCLAKHNPPRMQVLLEMGQGISLENTAAGTILTAELREQEAKKRRELEEERENVREATAAADAQLRHSRDMWLQQGRNPTQMMGSRNRASMLPQSGLEVERATRQKGGWIAGLGRCLTRIGEELPF